MLAIVKKSLYSGISSHSSHTSISGDGQGSDNNNSSKSIVGIVVLLFFPGL